MKLTLFRVTVPRISRHEKRNLYFGLINMSGTEKIDNNKQQKLQEEDADDSSDEDYVPGKFMCLICE